MQFLLDLKLMKLTKIILLFTFLFCFQSWTKADDIRDFQIEGMSIGDSALDYFSEKEIKKNIKNYYKNKDIKVVEIEISSKQYDNIQFHYRANDKTYKLIGISGLKFYPNIIKECYKKQNEVVKELKVYFPNTKSTNHSKNHSGDKSGKSKIKFQSFYLKSDDIVQTACFDWSKEMKYTNNFRVSLLTQELDEWFGIAYD